MKLSELLNGVKTIISHQKEIEKLKGENFNVFSILKMESKENETHSAFLGELLNPEGSHMKGNIFLNLFLEIIGNNTLDRETIKLKLEHHIGTKKIKEKTGGRIDIFLQDLQGNSISIENKIYAGDQDVQIERYCNYNKEKNTVYYLTLFGNEASKESRGELLDGEDYFCISYKNHIQQWLQFCLKEATDSPILRETIKQYLILIKKLTSTMDTKSEKELFDLMLLHYEESSYIFANFEKAKETILENFRQEVVNQLREKLNEKYFVETWNPISSRHAIVWIKFKEVPDSTLYFGIESFSGKGYGSFFIGIKNQGRKELDFEKEKNGSKQNESFYNGYWFNVEKLKESEGNEINLKDSQTLLKLHTDKEFFNELVRDIFNATNEYLSDQSEALLNYIKNG